MPALRILVRLTAFSALAVLGACGDSEAAPPHTAAETTSTEQGSQRTRSGPASEVAWEQFYSGVSLLYPVGPVPEQLGQALASPEFIGAPLVVFEQYTRLRRDATGDADPLEGIDRLESASASGCAAATLALAVAYLENTWGLWDEQTARTRYAELLASASKQGSVTATGIIGLHTVDGEFGFERNARAGRDLLLVAHEGGDYLATHNLGACYRDGSFGTPNRQRAIEYYEEAASRGYAKSFWALGEVFDPEDIPRSIAAFEQAHRMGHDRATYWFAERLARLYPLEYQDVERAKGLLQGLVDDESNEAGAAAFLLASLEEDRDGDDRLRWLQIAADQGVNSAHYSIGYIHLRRAIQLRYGRDDAIVRYGELDPVLTQRAFLRFQTGAEAGDAWCMLSMARLMVAGNLPGYQFSRQWLSLDLARDGDIHQFGSPDDVAIVSEAAGWICRARSWATRNQDADLVRQCDAWLAMWRMRCNG